MILICLAAIAIDGDTLKCRDGTHVRLAGIDAPELPGHCRRDRVCASGDPFAARRALSGLITGHTLRCSVTGASYGRAVAWCTAAGISLSCSQIQHGYAIRWDHYWPPDRRCP